MTSSSELVETVSFALPDGAMTGYAIGRRDGPIDLVFSHANGFNARTYEPLLRRIGGDRRILAIDLRGHGRTRLPTDPARLRNWRGYASDLAHVLDHIGAQGRPVALAGHSLGGTVSLLAATMRPGAVRALALLDPVFLAPAVHFGSATPLGPYLSKGLPLAVSAERRRADFDSHAAAVAAYRDKKAFARWRDGFLEAYVADGFVDTDRGVTLTCRPEWEAATFRAQGHDPWKALKRFDGPVHVGVAAAGSTVRGGAAAIESVRAGVLARAIEGSHFFPMENPEPTAALITKALTGS